MKLLDKIKLKRKLRVAMAPFNRLLLEQSKEVQSRFMIVPLFLEAFYDNFSRDPHALSELKTFANASIWNLNGANGIMVFWWFYFLHRRESIPMMSDPLVMEGLERIWNIPRSTVADLKDYFDVLSDNQLDEALSLLIGAALGNTSFNQLYIVPSIHNAQHRVLHGCGGIDPITTPPRLPLTRRQELGSYIESGWEVFTSLYFFIFAAAVLVYPENWKISLSLAAACTIAAFIDRYFFLDNGRETETVEGEYIKELQKSPSWRNWLARVRTPTLIQTSYFSVIGMIISFPAVTMLHDQIVRLMFVFLPDYYAADWSGSVYFETLLIFELLLFLLCTAIFLILLMRVILGKRGVTTRELAAPAAVLLLSFVLAIHYLVSTAEIMDLYTY